MIISLSLSHTAWMPSPVIVLDSIGRPDASSTPPVVSSLLLARNLYTLHAMMVSFVLLIRGNPHNRSHGVAMGKKKNVIHKHTQ